MNIPLKDIVHSLLQFQSTTKNSIEAWHAGFGKRLVSFSDKLYNAAMPLHFWKRLCKTSQLYLIVIVLIPSWIAL